jgi:CarD family transcriptional regulator
MFSIGEKVVHPMHGAGVIESIVSENVCGVTQDYYVFRMPSGGLLLKIPTANSDAVGLRPVISVKEAEGVLASIPELPSDMSSNWNRRFRENMIRIKSGDAGKVALVIKGLTLRDNARGLSTGERKMLRSAKQILISEIVLSESADYGTVEQRLDEAINRGA